MRFSLITPPDAEPVCVEEFKAASRVDHDAEDTLIASYLLAARQHIEALCGPIITQTMEMTMDRWPIGDTIVIGKPRATAINSIKHFAQDGSEETFSDLSYVTDFVSRHARIRLKGGHSWPSVALREINGVVVNFDAGWADAEAVPQDLKQSLILLAAHWYENREPIAQGQMGTQELPFAVSALIANHREWGF